jgi:hypothetical protein
VTGCEPPEALSLTWEFGGEVSWVEVRLSTDGDDATRLRLEHTATVDGPRWDEFGPGAVGVGWDLALLGLGEHLVTGRQLDPADYEGTPQALAFMRASSDAWAEASIAAGTPEAAARAAAGRTTAFYTGTGEGAEGA